MISEWQKCRSIFNHDWLKNRFIPALAKFMNLLDDRIEDVAFERSFVLSVLPQWESHRQKAFALPHDFEREMSPQRFLDLYPLSRSNEHTKQWLGNLVHALWITRYPVKKWVAEATDRAEKTDAVYQQLQKSLEECTDVQSTDALKPFRLQFAEFRSCCQDLAKAIEVFPSEVRVT